MATPRGTPPDQNYLRVGSALNLSDTPTINPWHIASLTPTNSSAYFAVYNVVVGLFLLTIIPLYTVELNYSEFNYNKPMNNYMDLGIQNRN